ncbi:kinetochore-associated protein 1 [Frankliniella occidentalis]|uniref:Kinetochore-associated protein 1 n=1 Tax=Frankliniella occidentalis TaxID=133901 RepID=A0A6J1S1C5_FRAOC|nr:kinetochore-associated protein 1 [Frankliniella occidentalis]
MEWNIRNDYDPGDETIHFGTRAYAESDGCIYEITTAATFQNDSEISDIPLLNFGYICNGGICVCVGKTITVFADASSSSALFNMEFDSVIETFAHSIDGNFLIVGLNNGFIHCLHIPSEGQPVYAKKVQTQPKSGQMFVKIIVDESFAEDVLVVCASGFVANLANFPFSSLHTALSNDDETKVKELLADTSLENLSGITSIAPIRAATTLKWNDELVILAVGNGIATLPTGLGSCADAVEIKWLERQSASTLFQIRSTSDKRLFIALNATGQLVRVCPFTLLTRNLTWKNWKPISDFQLTGNSTSEASIIALTASAEAKSNLSLMSFPGFGEKFSLAVGEKSVLMCTGCDLEDIPFLEFGCDKSNQTSTISLKSATQTVPMFRLERLLFRKKFEAAESLATNFGLDMTPVHMARAQNFLSLMEPWGRNTSDGEIQDLLKPLLNELDKIKDLDFVSNCCVSAVPPNYLVAHTLLEYAQKRLELFFVNNPELESKVSEWSASVCGSMLRLETLNLLKTSWNVEEWLDFSRADLLRNLQKCVKEGALSEASVIWCRHKSSFKSFLQDEYLIHCLLEEIPSWVALDKILEWLAQLLPSLLEAQPNALSEIVTWILQKISDLERSHPREWPKIGLDYADRTLKLMSSQNFGSPFVGLEASPLRPLVVLRCALTDLYSLRSKYYIFITLEEYSQSPSDVAVLLLDYIDVSSISAFVTGYFNGYVLDHRLDGDDIISTYIMCVLQSSDGWWNWDEAPWELRIATLIPHITNYKTRLQCINASLEAAPVPWSPLISNLAEEGLKLKHPLSSLIREKQKQIVTNLILKKYDLKTHINKINKKVLLKYIVKQNHPDMLSDIAELSQKSVDDYVTVIMHLFYMGLTAKALEVLQKVPNDMIVQICPLLIRTLSTNLDLDGVCDSEQKLEFISAVAVCHETARSSNPPGLTHIEDLHNPKDLPLSLEELKNRFRLKKVFRKFLTLEEMSSVPCRQKVLKDIVTELLIEVTENEKPRQRSINLYYQSMHAARLLMLPPIVALVEVVEQALEMSDLELATFIAGAFDDLNCLTSDVYKRLMKIPHLFLKKVLPNCGKEGTIQIVQDASAAVYHIASAVCSYCEQEHINEAIQTFGWARVWNFVSGQHDMSAIWQKDSLLNWRFTPLYKDPGMAGFLSGSYLHDFLFAAFNFHQNKDNETDFLSELNSSTVKLQNEQHDVALTVILCLIHTVMRMPFWRNKSDSPLGTAMLKTNEVLLSKVAGARQLDKHLSLSLLSHMGQSRAVEYLLKMCSSTQIDFQRQKALSCLGSIVTNIWKTQDVHSYFKLMSVQSTWGLRLSELGIPAKELLRGKSDPETVLQKLIGSKKVNSSLLQTLCLDYQLDFQEVLLQHLCAVLLSWDPNPLISINPDGTKEIIERNTQQQLLDQCWDIQKKIRNKNVLCNTLVSTWERVNFYHHEVFIVILEILERHGVDNQNNKRLITTFLKKYRRVKAPDQAEEEFWSEVFPSSFGLPQMSEFRLPFNRRLVDSPLLVARHEINLSTYKSWLSIAAALDIPKDKICTIAVHQTVTEDFSGYQNNMEWCGSYKNEALFESIASCVAEMDDVEQAAATLYFFMNKIPAGLDQVAAANLCLQYSEIVYNKTKETEYKMKIEKKFFHLATLQTLHQYGLGQPCYLQLAQNPTELINALYQHPTILELCRGTASHSLDINAAVEEISNVHKICLKTLHMTLVTEWLQPDLVMDCNTSLDEDCFRGMNLPRKKEQERSSFSNLYGADDTILRARYVMEHGDVQEWALFLISTVFNGESCVGMRLRAMQCLCMLTDDETLEELAGRPIASIREKYRTLAYLRDLEILGLTYSEAGFESCDKKELANLILRTQLQSPRAIGLLVHLCVDYKIAHMTLWNSILKQLIDLTMMKELEQALSYTSEMYQLWNLPTFRSAWNLLLTSPFSNSNFNSDDKESAMLGALTLFPTCPIMKHIDVAGAIEFCLANGRPEISALLLPYVEKSLIIKFQEKILSSRKLDDLLSDVKTITAERCINISKVLSIFSGDSN